MFFNPQLDLWLQSYTDVKELLPAPAWWTVRTAGENSSISIYRVFLNHWSIIDCSCWRNFLSYRLTFFCNVKTKTVQDKYTQLSVVKWYMFLNFHNHLMRPIHSAWKRKSSQFGCHCYVIYFSWLLIEKWLGNQQQLMYTSMSYLISILMNSGTHVYLIIIFLKRIYQNGQKSSIPSLIFDHWPMSNS